MEATNSTPRAATWHLNLLGRFEVISSSGEWARFSSRTALAMLAFLAVHKGREFPNFELQELFWPESDGDRQAQNLRRAIADLRKVLESDMPHGSVIATRKGHVSLTGHGIGTDLERFLELTLPCPPEEQHERLAEAVNLYAGPLLAPLNDYWITSSRTETEERFGQAVEWLCKSLAQIGAVREAIRVGRAAVVAAPLREDIHIALIASYRAANMEAEALRQFERLEQMLDENWGEPPSERAMAALAGSPSCGPTADPPPLQRASVAGNASGGALPIGSPTYVRRPVDDEIEGLIALREGVVLIHGPRQVGKSSLLARALAFARSTMVSVVLTDVQAMNSSEREDGERLYPLLAQEFASQLDLEFDLESAWGKRLGPNANLSAVIGKHLKASEGHVCWAIDEADLLFDRPYTDDFFGLLRSWHNRRALDPDGPWTKLTMVLSYATEANLFISDLNQSPFNVGTRLNLRDFTLDEVAQLQSRYPALREDGLAERVFGITRGHPHLSQCAYRFLASGNSVQELSETAAGDQGPFGTHLKHLLVAATQSEETTAEVRRLLRGEPFEHPTTRYRLQSAGLIVWSKDGRPEFRVPAYETYFRAAMG